MKPDALDAAAPRDDGARLQPRLTANLWLIAIVPLLLLAGLVLLLLRWGPADILRGDGYPPVEVLSFQRVTLGADGISATVMNDGPDPVTIAQVIVDDAYWQFTAEGGNVLNHLGRTTLKIPYPWVQGETHALKVVSSTGTTFDHEIAVAVETPRADPKHLGIFALIGLYVGVIPVALGLLWFPVVARLGKRGLDFLLALTIGLLLFLLVDAVDEGLEIARGIPGSFQGTALFLFGTVAAFFALEALGGALKARGKASVGWTTALLVAVGVGLHNFGEGLAIGAAFALGEAALGTLLIIGFTLHNTTEGLAIIAPLARERVPIPDLLFLGLIGGLPTIGGAWLGGLVYSPVLSVLFLSIGAGAIAQVVNLIARQMAGGETVSRYFARGPVLAGLAAGFVIMYSTGMLVG
ncbi:MAG: ZIP family metal transporter [Vicinamibacterales bacterium]